MQELQDTGQHCDGHSILILPGKEMPHFIIQGNSFCCLEYEAAKAKLNSLNNYNALK